MSGAGAGIGVYVYVCCVALLYYLVSCILQVICCICVTI